MRHIKKVLSAMSLLFVFFSQAQVMLHPNRGQWHSNISYKVELDMGEMLIENQGITYHFFDWHPAHHCEDHQSCNTNHDVIKAHVVKAYFVGSSASINVLEERKLDYYRNYFIGDDQSKWKSGIHAIEKVIQKEIYSNIDLIYESVDDGLKYSFEIRPGGNPKMIQIAYTGADQLTIDKKGRLIITTGLGEIIESKPVAWTEDENGARKSVKSKFHIDGTTVTFELGNYDDSHKLIIDPELAFSTFTGATSDNWGFTACPDEDGNLYGGGIVFGPGYPVTNGAYDITYNGGQNTGGLSGFDISITKFNSTGTANVYSTFLGGNGNEVPTSLVTNDNGELFVLTITSSTNFPTTANAFQTVFAGGPTVGPTDNVILGFNGSDLAITRFNNTGTSILASTYVGGSNNDGLSYGSNLNHNYGDSFRGEIIVDENNNVFFSSTTRSNNFPTASNFGSLSGLQDAIYGRLNDNLSNLVFCRYFGGIGYESGNSIQMSPAGDLYITGGTTSNGINFTGGGFQGSYSGNTDAYVLRVNNLTGAVMNGTYLGTGQYDQGYFVQTDLENQVYIFGQTIGNYPISQGLYGNPNSGQFIHKLSQNLITSVWSTRIGSGNGNINISPTAFLVSNCYDIYIAGWGGQINNSNSPYLNNTTTTGMPLTSDAYQSNSNGSNFYLAVLNQDASYLKYGTYIGGISSSSNHVDGGTSRFSKEGSIYHAVCGSCGGGNTNGFTTTPGVYAPNAAGPNCNLAAFKFDLNQMEASIGNVDPLICLPSPVNFINNSANGNFFIWNFGDGNISNDENPSHLYGTSGDYTISLIVIDTNNCYYSDTVYFDITIGSFDTDISTVTNAVCPDTPVQLSASGGATYAWSPAQFLNNPNIANPIATVNQSTTFTVIITDSCGIDTLSVFIEVINVNLEIIGSNVICIGQDVILTTNNTNLQNIQWLPSAIFSDPNSIPTLALPTESVNITLSAQTIEGCPLIASHFIQVDTLLPEVNLIDSTFICIGLSAQLTVSGGNVYEWDDIPTVTPLNGSTVTISTEIPQWYYVTVFNACGGALDSVFVDVIIPEIIAGNDTTICPGEIAFAWAEGGVSYDWQPQQFVSQSDGNTALLAPQTNTVFTVFGTDNFGCIGTATVHVDLFALPFVQTTPNIFAFQGDQITISAIGSSQGTYSWQPQTFLSCPNCQTTAVNTAQNMVYTVHFEDENGCTAQDQINISFDALIYVPNTFTPDQDKFNPVFAPKGGNIVEYHLMIFNRWGEILFESFNFNVGWDGTYGGQVCQDDTYVWVISYTDSNKNKEKLFGHVNLLK